MTKEWPLLPKANNGVKLRILRRGGYPGTWVCPECKLGVPYEREAEGDSSQKKRRQWGQTGGDWRDAATSQGMLAATRSCKRQGTYFYVILVFVFNELPGSPIFLLGYLFPRRSLWRLGTVLAVP